jgi:hypothetical protein
MTHSPTKAKRRSKVRLAPAATPPQSRYREGQPVWLTRRQETGDALHYPCHVLSFNRLTGLYSVARADDRQRHTFADAESLAPRHPGEIAPGVKPRTRTEELVTEGRR